MKKEDREQFADFIKEKADNYDRLIATLKSCGLAPDTLIIDVGKSIEIIAIENRELATPWFESTPIYNEDLDDD